MAAVRNYQAGRQENDMMAKIFNPESVTPNWGIFGHRSSVNFGLNRTNAAGQRPREN
jgi:hypothetical protein